MPCLIVVIVKLIFKLVGLVALGFGIYLTSTTYKKYRLAQQLPSWLTTEGTIIASRVVAKTTTHSSDTYDGDHYGYSETFHFEPFIEYEYSVNDEMYKSKRRNIWDLTDHYNDRALVQKYLSRFPEGEPITVWYDPEDPATSVIDPDYKAGFMKTTGIVLIMLAVGILFLILG